MNKSKPNDRFLRPFGAENNFVSLFPRVPLARGGLRFTRGYIQSALRASMISAVFIMLTADALADESGEPAADIRVARLQYNDDPSAACFTPLFLDAFHDATGMEVAKQLLDVPLDSEALFEHPFVVMAGNRGFTLTEAQRESLRLYLQQGGFLVASAGCSSAEWAGCFQREMNAMFPGVAWRDLPMDDAVFHAAYAIRSIHTQRPGARPVLRGLEIGGRLAVVFASDGLNDSLAAAPECCCCGGNEIENAREVNVNLLGYALTR